MPAEAFRVQSGVVLVGPLPPPVNGMAAVNLAVFLDLQEAGAKPLSIDTSPGIVGRSLAQRVTRAPKLVAAGTRLALTPKAREKILYLSASGGLGQLYEILFTLIARLRGMRICIHHHSYSYLDRRNLITAALVRAAGQLAIHVCLSEGMEKRLKARYSIRHAVVVSNARFISGHGSYSSRPKTSFEVLGFLGNISAAKGIFHFLDLMQALSDAGIGIRGLIAGPFQDKKTERQVLGRLAVLPSCSYRGAIYGIEKDDFFSDLSALAFPTEYSNEAEPLVMLEAFRHGVPIIAYGRGCIPERIGPDIGLVVEPGAPFVPAAFEHVRYWLENPSSFESASRRAKEQFEALLEGGEGPWHSLKRDLLTGHDFTHPFISNHEESIGPRA